MPEPKRVAYAPLFVLSFAVVFLGAVLGWRADKIRTMERAAAEIAQVREGCVRGVQTSCGQLELMVKQPCLDRREGASCLWLGYLNERLLGVDWIVDVGYVRGDIAASSHFGIACAKGIPAACEILQKHYERPSRRCPFNDGLNPLGPALWCPQ